MNRFHILCNRWNDRNNDEARWSATACALHWIPWYNDNLRVSQMQHMSPFSPFHHLLCMYMRCYVYIVHFNSKTMHIISMKRAGERESNDSVRIIQRYLNRIDIRHFRTLSGIAWRKEGKKKESMPASIHTQLVLEIYFARWSCT